MAHLRHLPFRRDLNAEAARQWALEESGARAARDIDVFVEQLQTMGWASGKVLLSSAERAPYRVEAGADLASDLAQALAAGAGGADGGSAGGGNGGSGAAVA